MKTAQLGDYLLWEGRVVKVLFINPGSKAIGMETLEDKKCPHCGGSLGKEQFEIIESSPMFQEGAKPLQTINN
jgi:hypothetical protein